MTASGSNLLATGWPQQNGEDHDEARKAGALTKFVHNRHHLVLLLLILLSLPVKLIAAQNMPWDMDYVPVVALGQQFFDGGPFPVYGTLSSVAAYNMPFLVWMQMPAMLLTSNPWWVIFLTQLVFNITGTVYVYRLGAGLFNPAIGAAAAIWFTFSETGVSSAYTAWAQLLLPSFFAIVVFHLWRWRIRERGANLAIAGVVAVAAFMTHFAAIMLFPAMLVMALLMRARWQWRWLVVGVVGALVLLGPYLVFQVERDFVDVMAFLRREPLVTEEALNAARIYRDEGRPAPPTQPTTAEADIAPSAPDATPRWQRAVVYALSLPGQTLEALGLIFQAQPRGLQTVAPALAVISTGVNAVLALAFAAGVFIAVASTVTALRRLLRAGDAGRLAAFSDILVKTPHGRAVLLSVFILTVIAGLLVTRASPGDQQPYYLGIVSLQAVLMMYGAQAALTALRRPQWRNGVLIVLVGAAVLTSGAERVTRIDLHDDDVFSRHNVSLYRHIEAATDFIAADWAERGRHIVVSYDLLPEMGNMWWVPAWHSVDARYRVGAPYDHLLWVNHRLENANTSADGLTENADYIVVTTPGLARYDSAGYDVATFGAIAVLRPQQ